MRGFLYVFAAMAVIASAFWAYQENYTTQSALREVRGLYSDIGAAHDRLQMLRAEWAYLNRPDRLADLADLNFDRLGLLSLQPEAFGRVDQIIYPIPPILPITDPIEISNDTLDLGEDPL
ncbi:cell division protein FtsL [Yoonia sp.]|uniref:cell division protein FtsL n=1 Tax=Yoonia sp. TaxID=2212373 RepID=UPI003F700E41